MTSFQQFQFVDEEGRQKIYQWSEKRRKKFKGVRGFLEFMKIFAFDKSLMKSFLHNINIIVLIQMVLSGVITFLCNYANLFFEVHVTLFVSPLVFPLAFSINTDFQRREKVLEDLANFKASTMVWFFCLRDWRAPAEFSEEFMKSAFNKAKGLMFHLREYLLTEKRPRRDFIVRVLYEDLSDVAQINEKIRTSKLQTNAPILARVIHLHYLMCLSFERLRVIREYRSPRSIRSFTKVFIFALPLLLSPYYVYLGRKANSSWSPYFIAVLVAFLFGALQGVQDKLDDPFDGMSEDDIDLETLDEWTVHSLEANANRTTRVGRFTVSVFGKGKVEFTEPTAVTDRKSFLKRDDSFAANRSSSKKKLGLLPWQRQLSQLYSDEEASTNTDEFKEMHPYKDILSNLPGNATIVRGGHVKEKLNFEELNSSANSSVSRAMDILDPTFYQLHTPSGTVQRSLDGKVPTSATRKLQFSKVLFDRDNDPEGIAAIRAGDEADACPPMYDVPNTFEGLFPSQSGQVAIQMEPLKKKNSLPLTGFLPYEGQGSRNRKRGDRSDSLGMIAHSGVGAASYINAMNKDKFRKTSACSLRGSIEKNSQDTDFTSISGDECLELKIDVQTPQNKKRFRVEKAKTLNLTPIVPNVKDEKDPSADSRSGNSDEKTNSGLTRTKPSSMRNRSSSKTKLLDDRMNSFEAENPGNYNSINIEENTKMKKRKFSIKKSESDSKLICRDVDSSSDSLSNFVGKLKDEEVFL